MKRILTLNLLWLAALPIAAQSYMDKAERFSYDTLNPLVLNDYASVEWQENGSRYFSYRVESPDSETYYLVDTKDWSRTQYPDRKRVRSAIDSLVFRGAKGKVSETGKSAPSPGTRKDWTKEWSSDSLFFVRAFDDDIYLFKAVTDSAGRPLTGIEPSDSIRLSNDGVQWASYAVGGNSFKPSKGRTGALGRWIGDSHQYVLVKEDERSVGELTIVKNLAEPRPVAKTYKYAMPGDTGVVKYSICLADADSGRMYRLDIDRYKDQKLLLPLLEQYPMTDRYVYFIRVSRTLDTLDLLRVDGRNHSVETIISEECKPHFNEVLFDYHVINDGKEILWWSERTGKGRYYLYDGEGGLKGAVTPDNIVAGKIVKIDTLGRSIIYEGYGGEEGADPCYKYYYRATFKGRNNLLTPGRGDHSVTFSPDGKYIVDTYSRMDLAPHYQICDLKGNVRFEMEPADLSKLYERGWKEPELVEFMAADSVTRLYGVVYLPFDLDPSKKYPVISSVYPGPMTDLVPLAFMADDNYNQSLAQLGFIVVNVSYRGSNPYRGRDFYTYGYGNLRDYALEDDYAVLQQVAEKYPFADLDRVGIYGHSGGGFMTVAAMLTRPDFYKVGFAASGNHDNNIYSQWWGETYHGVRQMTGDGGETSFECRIPTNIELAGNLKGKLMLVTGDEDDNVHPASTIRLAKALIDHGKRFDMMILPGKDHQLWCSYYVNLIRYFFTENLLGLPQNDTDIVNHK